MQESARQQLTFLHAGFGKEFPSRTLSTGRSRNCSSPSAVLCPLLYRTEHFSRGRKERKKCRERGGRGGAKGWRQIWRVAGRESGSPERKFPKLPQKFPDFPGGQPLSLGSLTPSADSQKLSPKRGKREKRTRENTSDNRGTA